MTQPCLINDPCLFFRCLMRWVSQKTIHNSSKWSLIVPEWLGMVGNVVEWWGILQKDDGEQRWMVENYREWVRTVGNGWEWWGMVKNCDKWIGIGGNGEEWWRMGGSGVEWWGVGGSGGERLGMVGTGGILIRECYNTKKLHVGGFGKV